MHEEDAVLVRACLDRDASAFNILLDRYKDRIFTFILRLVRNPADAEDLAQDTFIKAFRKLASYDTSRPMLTWLFRIAHNTVIDFKRKQRGKVVSLDADEEPMQIREPGPSLEEAAVSRHEGELVDRMLAALPDAYRETLILRHKEGMDVAEIARALEVPVGTIKARLSRARGILKESYIRMQPNQPELRNPNQE